MVDQRRQTICVLISYSEIIRRWTAAEEDDRGGSSSKWTPVKRCCFSAGSAWWAEKRVRFVSVCDGVKYEIMSPYFSQKNTSLDGKLVL